MTIIFENETKLLPINKNNRQYETKLMYTDRYPIPYRYNLFIVDHHSTVIRISKRSQFSI